MSISASYPTLRPTLLLDFANSGRLDPRVTFTRASTATYFDEIGVLQSAAINAPRFDYDPATLAARGFLIEESRTNSIRNNTGQGAVAGSPGTPPTYWFGGGPTGVTRTIVGTGTENGISYVDVRYNGTATASGNIQVGFETVGSIAATVGQAWSLSTYWKLVAGTTTGITNWRVFINEYSSAPAYLISQVVFVSAPTSAGLATQRAFGAMTTANASCAFIQPVVGGDVANGTTIDITLRIGLPQLELGAFATSVIPTTTTALTRSADVASVNTLSPWYNAAEGTLYCEGVSNASSVDGTNLALSDGTNNNRIQFGTGASNTVWNPFVVVSGSSVATLTQSVSFSPKTNAKLALAYKVNDFAATTAGASPVTDTSGAVPTLNILRIGASGAGVVTWNSWIRRITYYPRKLSSAELQAITA